MLVGLGASLATPGRLEMKINCPLWDKSVEYQPGELVARRREGLLSAGERANLARIRGFFAYRVWELGADAPRQPRLPPTADEIARLYGSREAASR
jgi:hypothetical protein